MPIGIATADIAPGSQVDVNRGDIIDGRRRIDEVEREIRDPVLAVAGVRRMQAGIMAAMVRKVPFLVGYLSQVFPWHPGDVVSTGVPVGVGLALKPARLTPGDVVELGTEGLGTQRQVSVAGD